MFGPSLARLLLRASTVHSLRSTLPAIAVVDDQTARQLERELVEQIADLELGRMWLSHDDADVLRLAESGLAQHWLTPAALTSLVDSRRESDVVVAHVRLWLEAARAAALPDSTDA